EAMTELKKAIKIKQPFRPNSYMTLAVVLKRQGRSAAAQKLLLRTMRIFGARQDTDRLSIAQMNLGLVYKDMGRIKDARSHYYQSLYLSRLNRNQYMCSANLINLAVSYELEGRTDRAIQFYKRSARIAKTFGLKRVYAQAMANSGLQYAFQSRFSK